MKAGILIFANVALLTPAIATPQQGETEQEQKLVWTCPLHREVTETEAGQCEFCERQLVQTLVQLAWSCPIHPVVVESESGQCPICQRDLFLITEEVRYACPMHPEEKQPRARQLRHLPHGTGGVDVHQATSGSQSHSTAVCSSWRRTTGTTSRARIPRRACSASSCSTNFSEPLNAKEFKGRAVLKEVFDADTRETRELLAYSLLASPDGAYLEAHVGTAAFPREMTAKVQFEARWRVRAFRFHFRRALGGCRHRRR